MDEIERKIHELTYRFMLWIEANFGRTGCFVVAFTVIILVVVGLLFLYRLGSEKETDSLPEKINEAG